MPKQPSGRGKDSGRYPIPPSLEKAPTPPAPPLIDYAKAVATLNIDDMRTLRRHHPSLHDRFEDLDTATLGYWSRLETEVELLKREMDELRQDIAQILKGKQQ